MARRVYVHVGTPKTGTTYLQSVLWANKPALSKQGLLLPLDAVRGHFYVATVVRNAAAALKTMPPAGHKAWDRMLGQIAEWHGDVIISHELLAATSRRRARWAIDQLRAHGTAVHVIVTARDLARQIPAEWQQSVKHGRTHTLTDFYAILRAEDPRADPEGKPTVLFWSVQDLPRVLANWAADLPPEHVHVVTVPPSGAARGLLWQRFATLIGLDPDSVDTSVTLPNESLGVVEIETLRRVNELVPADVPRPQLQLMVKQVLAEGVLAARDDMVKFAPPADVHPWVVERGTAMVDALRTSGYDVVGDLDELLPSSQPLQGPHPDDVESDAIAKVALQTVTSLLFSRDDLSTHKFVHDLKEQRAALERRTQEVEELQRLLAKANHELGRDGRPLRVRVRRQLGRIKRRMNRRAP